MPAESLSNNQMGEMQIGWGPPSSGANKFGKQKSSNTLELRLSHKGGTQRVFLLLNSVDNVAIL